MSETKTNENTLKLVKGAMETELVQLSTRKNPLDIYTYSIPVCSTLIYLWDREGAKAFNSSPHPQLSSLMKEILLKVNCGEAENGDKSKSARLGIFENVIMLGFPLTKWTTTEEAKVRDRAKSVLTATITELKKGLAGIDMRIDEETLTDPIKIHYMKSGILSRNPIWAVKR